MKEQFYRLSYPESTRGTVRLEGEIFEPIVCPITKGHNSAREVYDDMTVVLSSERIKDFVWSAYGDCFIQDGIKQMFNEQGFTGFVTEHVKVKISPYKKRSQEQPIPTPPSLSRLAVTGWGGVVPPESGIKLKRSCPGCGRRVYTGTPDSTLMVDEAQWDGSDFFFVWPYPVLILVTHRVAEFAKENKLTGVRFVPIEDVDISSGAMPGRLAYYMPEDRARKLGEPLGIY